MTPSLTDSNAVPARCGECGGVLPRGEGTMCPTCLLRGGVTLPEMETTAFQRLPDGTPVTGPSKVRPPGDSRKPEEEWIGDRYRLVEKLGEGGFGLVWRAEQLKPIRRMVAVKILKAGMDTRQVIARFEAERQVLALMDHPNIARVLDAGETDRGRPYFVMEVVKGVPITSYVRSRELTVNQRLRLFLDVCSAVHHAHQKGIIHRDLKPSNVMVADSGGVATVKVIDFGIAKAMQGPLTDQTIDTGFDQLVGTPGFISPEQIAHGNDAVDTRSDVYALGSILFELLCGKPLVSAAEMAQKPLHHLLRDLLERDAPPPSNRDPSVKGDLDWVTLKALAHEPDRRYASADALAEDLRRYLGDLPVLACPPSSGYLIGKFAKRHRFGVAATAAVMLAVLVGGMVSTLLYFRAEAARQETSKGREEMRRAYSAADTQMARQYSERDRFSEAVSFYCRALRTDGENPLAAINLLTLMQYVHMIHPATHHLALPGEAKEARFVAVSRKHQRALAVTAQRPPGHAEGALHLVSVWDLRSEVRRDYEVPGGKMVQSLAVMPDESMVVIGLDSGQVLTWSLVEEDQDGAAPGSLPRSLPRSVRWLPARLRGSVLTLSCCGSGARVAAGSDQGEIVVWDTEALERPLLQLDQQEAVTSLGLSAEGGLLVAAQIDGRALASNLTGTERLDRPMLTPPGLSKVAANEARRLVAMGFNHGVVQLRDSLTGQQELPDFFHPAAVTSVTLSDDGDQLVVGDAAGWLHRWNTQTGQMLEPARQHDGEIVAAVHGKERGLVVSVSLNGEVQVWNPESGLRKSHRLRRSVAALALSADCSWLALSPKSTGVIQIWHIQERMSKRRYLGPAAEMPGQALPKPMPQALIGAQVTGWSRNGRYVAAGYAGGVVRVLDSESWEQVGVDMDHSPAVGVVAVSNDGQLAFSSGRDRTVRGWRVETGETSGLALQHESFVPALALTEDEARLVTVTDPGEIRVWEVGTGEGLTPGIWEGQGMVELFVPPGDERMRFRVMDGTVYELPLPPQDLKPLPEWFLQLAENLSQFTEAERRDWVMKALHEGQPEEGRVEKWATWLASEPEERSLFPEDRQSFGDYLDELKKQKEKAAVAELMRHHPSKEPEAGGLVAPR